MQNPCMWVSVCKLDDKVLSTAIIVVSFRIWSVEVILFEIRNWALMYELKRMNVLKITFNRFILIHFKEFKCQPTELLMSKMQYSATVNSFKKGMV